MIREVVIAAALLGWSTVASADEATAKKNFEAGERAYNLGDFQKAVDLFKQSYDEWPEPAFLFNVAQTYRQLGDCKQAQFFYKRFLALKEQDTKKPIRAELRTEVENRIAELEECIKRELAAKPPTQLESGTGPVPPKTSTTKTTSNTTTKTSDETAENSNEDENKTDEDETPAPTPAAGASQVAVRLEGGAAKLSAGKLDPGVQFAGALLAGYPLTVAPNFQLELGAAFGFSVVPYKTDMNEAGSLGLVGVLANVSPRYEVIPKLSVRADLGGGVLVLTGLEKMGNPFTDMGSPATGALTTLRLRGGVGVDYAVTDNIIIAATPFAYGYSPAPKGFVSGVSKLTEMSFMVGVGYRR